MKFIESFDPAQEVLSPSTRRAWIEIVGWYAVDTHGKMSPSTRRAWIEIASSARACSRRASPSTRRAWIEILYGTLNGACDAGRPPHGGRGLKSPIHKVRTLPRRVALHTEGVD